MNVSSTMSSLKELLIDLHVGGHLIAYAIRVLLTTTLVLMITWTSVAVFSAAWASTVTLTAMSYVLITAMFTTALRMTNGYDSGAEAIGLAFRLFMCGLFMWATPVAIIFTQGTPSTGELLMTMFKLACILTMTTNVMFEAARPRKKYYIAVPIEPKPVNPSDWSEFHARY